MRDPAAWVEVAAGKYRVGDRKLAEEIEKEISPWKNAALPDETVCFERPFQLSKYAVSHAQFRRFVDSGYTNKSLWNPVGLALCEENEIVEPYYWRDPKWNGATQPVVGVSWWEADAFCRWVGCRLATEREWEAAAPARKAGHIPGVTMARGHLQLG